MKKLIFVLILITYNFAYSQTRYIVVLDSVTQKPIPYSNVYNKNENVSQYTDMNGRFRSFNNKIDSIIISHTGYKSVFLASIDISDTIFLQKKTVLLPPVAIKYRKFTEEYRFGNFEYSKNNTMHYWITSEFIRKVKIENFIDYYQVKSLFMPMKINPDYSDSCQCIVHLYKLSKENNLEDILNESIILKYNSIPKDYFINIENQNIILTDSVLYIGLECFFNIPDITLKKYFTYDYNASKSFSKHLKNAPILFYFDTEEIRKDKNDGLTLMRTKKKNFNNSYIYKWDPSIFTAGIVIKTL
jgi:hypothetical protein